MKIVFVSNYFNHHQKPFCEEMYKRLGTDFSFVATGMIGAERLKLGYAQNDTPPYVHLAYSNAQEQEIAMVMIREADVVIAGGAPESYLRERLKMDKLVIRYSERPFKKEPSFLHRLYQRIRFHQRDLGNRNVYMLCAGGYAAADFESMGMYKNRMYQWGYFPTVKEYDISALLSRKKRNTILWCGRFIDWKHPDDAVKLAQMLKQSGYDFQLKMIGSGTMEEELKRMAQAYDVADVVHFLGSMSPDQVRMHMEEAGIYVCTSDRQEGWGAVLNEAMNSGCTVIASDMIGAVPFLVQNGRNGMLYPSGNHDSLFETVKDILDNPRKQFHIGYTAYQTITDVWNADVGVSRLMKVLEKILAQENPLDLFDEGPCSVASVFTSNTY